MLNVLVITTFYKTNKPYVMDFSKMCVQKMNMKI